MQWRRLLFLKYVSFPSDMKYESLGWIDSYLKQLSHYSMLRRHQPCTAPNYHMFGLLRILCNQQVLKRVRYTQEQLLR